MFESSDSLEEPPIYERGDVVWVKLSNYWWPGEVKTEEDLSKDLVLDFKKPPKVIVKFFDEDSYEYINKWSNIYPYNCERKSEFIKKGMAKYRGRQSHMSKFPKDIGTAEEKTNGDPNILSQSEFLPAKKIDLDEIFGTPKQTPKKTQKELYQPTISHRRFLGKDDYKSIIMYQYPGKDRQPDSDSEDIQKQYDGPQNDLACDTCSFQTKRLGVFLNHCKTHLDGSFAAAKRKSKISEYDFIESDSEATPAKPSKPKQRKKPVKKQTKELSVDNWLDEWNDSDEEMEAKEKGDGIAASIKDTSSGKIGNQSANNHTAASASSLPNTKDDIKNCFDFDDDDEVDFSLLSPVIEGRKIPRVIPEKPEASITDLSELSEEDELAKEKNLEAAEKPEQSSETDPDLNKKEILRVSQSFNRGLDIDDSAGDTFKEIMEVTEVPALDDLSETLKPEQNFHDARAVKFPDKGGTDTVKEISSTSSKSDTSKKMTVPSFNDFEIGFHKVEDEDSREQDVAKKQELQESTTSKSEAKEILDAEMEEINKVLETDQNLASEEIINQQEISLEQLTRDLEGSSDTEQNGDQKKTRQKSNETHKELKKNISRGIFGRFKNILKKTKSKKNYRDEFQALVDVKPQEDGSATVPEPVQLEKQRITRLNKVDNQTDELVPKQEEATESSYKDSSKQTLRRGRSSKNLENEAREVSKLDFHEIPSKEIAHESKKSQLEKPEIQLDPEMPLEDAVPDAVQIEAKIVKATNHIVDDIVDISLKKRSHYRIRKYKSEMPEVEKRSPSRRHKSEISLPDNKIDDRLTESSKAEKEEVQIPLKIREKTDVAEEATSDTTSFTSRKHAKSHGEKISPKSHKNKSEESAFSSEVSGTEKQVSVEKKNKSRKHSHVEKEVAIGSANETENIDAKSEPMQSTKGGNLISKVVQSGISEPVSTEKPSRRRRHKSRGSEESASRDKTLFVKDTSVVGIDPKPAEILSEASLMEPEIPFPTVANTEIREKVVNVPIENQHVEDFLKHQLVYTAPETLQISEKDTSITESISIAGIEIVADTEKSTDVDKRRGRSEDKEETIEKTNIEKTMEDLNFLSKCAKRPQLYEETIETAEAPSAISKSVELHEDLAKNTTAMDVSSIPLPYCDIDVSKTGDTALTSPKSNKDNKWEPTHDDAEAALPNDGGRRLRSFRRVSSHVSKEYLPAVPAKSPPRATADMDRTEVHESEASNITTEEKSKLLSPKTPGIVIEKLYGQKPKGGRAGRSRSRWDVISCPEEPVAVTFENMLKEKPVSTKIELPAIIQENTFKTSEINDETVVPEENAVGNSDINFSDYQNIVSFETVVTDLPEKVTEEKIESIIEPELLADIPLPPEPSPMKRVEEIPVKSHKKHKSRRKSYCRKSSSEKHESNYSEDSVSRLATPLESIPLPTKDDKCLVSELLDNSLCAAQDAIVQDFDTESSNCQSDEKSAQEILLEKGTLNDAPTERTEENFFVEKFVEQSVIEISAEKQSEIIVENPNNVDALPSEAEVPQEVMLGIVSEARVIHEAMEGAKTAIKAQREIEKETVGTDVQSTKQEIMQTSELEPSESHSQSVAGLVKAQEKIEKEKIETDSIEQIMHATPEVTAPDFNNQPVEKPQVDEKDFEEAQQKIENKKIETAGESTKLEIMQDSGTEFSKSNTETVNYLGIGLLETQPEMETEKIQTDAESIEEIIQATATASGLNTQLMEKPQVNEEDFVEDHQRKTERDVESIQATKAVGEGVAETQHKIESGKTVTSVESINQEIMTDADHEFLEPNCQTSEELQLHGDGVVVEAEHEIESEKIETPGKSIIEQKNKPATKPEIIEPKIQISEKPQGEGVIEDRQKIEDKNDETSLETTEPEIMQVMESEGSESNTETLKICELQGVNEIEIVQAIEPEIRTPEKPQLQGEGAKEVEQKIEGENIETSKEFVRQETEQSEVSKLNTQTVEQECSTVQNVVKKTLEVQQNIEKEKFETPVESIEKEIMKSKVPEVSQTRMQTVEQVISDTVEQLFQSKGETVVMPKEWSSRGKWDKISEAQFEDESLMHNIDDLEIEGSSSLATLAAASVILENRDRGRLLPKKYFQSEDIAAESTQDVLKITEKKLKSVPPKKKWPRRSSLTKKDSDIKETSEKIKSDPFEFTLSEKTESPSQETITLDSEIILPPKKAKRISEASFLQSSCSSEDRISPENKSDVDMSFPTFDDSFMSTSLRNNIEGIINTFDTSGSTSSELHSADGKCVLPKKKRIEDSIEKVGENMPRSPKKKMQKLFENSQIFEKSTTELPLMSPLAKKKSFLFQQEEFEQSKIEPKTNVDEPKNEINVDEFLNVSTKRKKRKSSSYETCPGKKEKKNETESSAELIKSEVELRSNLPGTAPSTKGSKTEDKPENAFVGVAEIDINKEEIIVPTLNEAELVPISVTPTVMTETDLADTQVEITTTEVISKKAPTTSLESTLKNIISGKKIGGGSKKKIGEGSGTKFTSKAMLKEFDHPFRSQIHKRKSDLLDILEGNSNSSTNSSGSEQKFKTSFDNYDTTNTVAAGNIDFEDDIPRSEILLTSKGPDSVIMDSPRLLERLSMASGSKPQNQKVMVQSDLKVHKKLVMPKLVKPTDVPRAGQKIFIKTGKPGGTPVAKITGNKPIILSEQILRPATATTPTAIQPQGIKRQYEDIEDVETAFIIPKISKKTEQTEEIAIAPKLQEKPAQSRGSKATAKSKIKQQTIISEVVPQTATATASTSTQFKPAAQTVQDDSMFDISNMPVVLSEDLTAECIQNMPVILSEDILPQTSVGASPTPQHQDKILAALSKKLVPGGKQIIFKTSQPMAGSASMAGKTVTKSKLLQNPSGTVQTRIAKTGTPALFATCTTPDGKQAKYVLVPPAGTVSALPSRIQTVPKTIIKKQTAIHQKNVASGSGVAPGQDQLGGNKIMIVTNSQGQQTRTVLTPQQQVAWMQTQGGIKRTIIKGAIAKALLDSGTLADLTPGGIMVPTTASTLDATPTVSCQASVLMPIKATYTTKKGAPRTKPQKTVLIKNQMGETVRRIQGPNNADLERQVAEQLEAIKAMARQQARKSQETASNLNRQIPSSMPSTSGKQVARRFTKKVEQKLKIPPSTVAQGETQNSPEPTGIVPALAPLSPQTRVSAISKPTSTRKMDTASAKAPEVRQQTTIPTKTEAEQESTLPDSKQVVLRDAAGNLSTVTVGQILALPNDLVYGQPQTYVLVKVDESGTLQPLNNDALLSLDPSLSLGPEINNVVLNVDHDQGTVSASKPPEVIDSQQKAIQEVQPNQELVPVTQESQYSEQLQSANDEAIVPAEQLGQQETSIAVEQQILIGEGVLPGDAGGQQLMITGDQIATQKFIESLSNGSIDLGSILANAESGSVIVQTDGQQLLIRTNTLPQQAMLGCVESTEGGGNPMFATHRPNQDILAAALADTDVFQPALEPPLKSRGHVSPPGGSSSPGGGPGLYPMNAGNVLETSLTLNVPIMSPLELPSNNNKKIDDEAEILNTVSKNVDLPITITDPNIVQTVAHQQAVGLLELSLPISEVGPITGMNSPSSFSYSLPSLDDSSGIQKSFSGSMPLLTEDAVESGNSASLDQMTVTKDLDVVSTSFNSDFGSMPRLSEAIESTREEVVETTSYNEFIGSMLNMSEDDVIDDSESSESRKSRRSKKRSILDQGLAIFGGKMCSSLSEPPPEMFEFDALTTPQREEEISSDISSVQEPETLSLNSENSDDIPLQPPIIASLSDLKAPNDDSASSGSDNKNA